MDASGLVGSWALISVEDGGVTIDDSCACRPADGGTDPDAEYGVGAGVGASRCCIRLGWPRLTSSVMRSKYTSKLRNTS